MGDPIDPEFLDYFSRAAALEPARARRLIEDVLAEYGETAEDFVRRRHRELQTQGLRNDAIYARIQQESATRRFAIAPLTERQVRRLIYG